MSTGPPGVNVCLPVVHGLGDRQQHWWPRAIGANPVNAWTATLILAVGLDLAGAHARGTQKGRRRATLGIQDLGSRQAQERDRRAQPPRWLITRPGGDVVK